jgi:hypothetical protein
MGLTGETNKIHVKPNGLKKKNSGLKVWPYVSFNIFKNILK